ncbi:PREDICTED: C-C motif chemokine 4 homolog [Fulmarus glacialis]|uniref:C-C motif chemokine 4 homolog n=1 Tax=Fulmarus glacialis TaxID=30455 RepID=UPI00051B5B20|nr:PREDICTED: C-C motif chemokine 4 homolog [Fulmarus glacialis]
MKVSVAALAVLIAAFCYQTSAAPFGSDPPTSLCSQPAVVFVTRKGREVCANPEQDWVQQYVNDLELS